MLRGIYEFRGYEERTSKQGNRYINVFAEDTENGQAVRFYVGQGNFENCNPSIYALQKGDLFEVTMLYHQGYGGGYTSDFVKLEISQ